MLFYIRPLKIKIYENRLKKDVRCLKSLDDFRTKIFNVKFHRITYETNVFHEKKK